MIRMIVTDIDGTLLPNASPPPGPDSEAAATVKAVLDSGIRIVLASGRPFSALRRLFPDLHSRLSYICSNGSVVAEGDEIIRAVPLGSQQKLRNLMAYVRKRGEPWHIDAVEDVVTETYDEAYIDIIKTVGCTWAVVEDVLALDKPLCKMSLCYWDGSAGHFHDPEVEVLKKDFNVAPAGMVFLDLNSPDADKGKAIRFLCDRYGIAPEEYMVFGDAMNDLSMLQGAPNSWCSEQSPEKVKKVCRHTFAPPEEGGVLKILQGML